jgi:hypothetical protein
MLSNLPVGIILLSRAGPRPFRSCPPPSRAYVLRARPRCGRSRKASLAPLPPPW